MPKDNGKSRLKEIAICKLIVTKTLVGNDTENSLARSVYQIWLEDGGLISSLDYKDEDYDVICHSFSGTAN